MNQNFSIGLLGILERLAKDCEASIKPNQCLLEPAEENTKYYFKIPGGTKRTTIAWGQFKPQGWQKYNQPCVLVSVSIGAWGLQQFFQSDWDLNKKTINYDSGGMDQFEIGIYKIGDTSYKLVLKLLIKAAKAAL